MSNWISCKDRLPEVGLEVLTYGPNGIKSDRFSYTSKLDGKHVFDGDHIDYNIGVTYWMPLPEAPKP
jgi:hypothetical protein